MITEEAGLEMTLSTLNSNTRDYKNFKAPDIIPQSRSRCKNCKKAQLKMGKHTNISGVNR